MRLLLRFLPIVAVAFLFASCEEDYTTKSSVYGVVVDAKDNTPIEGALVTILNTGVNRITDKDGYYEFPKFEFQNKYKIKVFKDGYYTLSQQVVPFEVRERIEINIRLEKQQQ